MNPPLAVLGGGCTVRSAGSWPNTGLIYKTFRFSETKIWNYVEANVSINSSYTSFKRAIKCHLLGNNVNNLFRSVKCSH